ncbi:MAG: cytochrome c oxidase subunit II [Planctomycetota bacterium]|jgi:cytochrome c oxidase subunit 2
MRSGYSRILLIAFFAGFTGLCVIGFMQGWRKDVASEEGVGIDGVLSYLLMTTGVLIVLGHIVLCWFIWKGDGDKVERGRPTAKAQWMWSLIPVFVMLVLSEAGVLAFGGPVWTSMYVDRPADALKIEVIGKQFEWFVRYPGKDGVLGKIDWEQVDGADNPIGMDEDDPAGADDIIKRGQIHLPKGRAVIISLRTQDVIHSFWVPQFRVKQDVLPGFTTNTKITPNRLGDYELVCTELCGLGHYKMRGEVHVVEPATFEEWLSKQMTFGG